MNQTLKISRILAVALTGRGFGYTILEGEQLIRFGNKSIDKDKNAKSLIQIGKMIVRYDPRTLVLSDVTAKRSNRVPRIKALHEEVIALAKQHKLMVIKISADEVRLALLGNEHGTKYEAAQFLAERFPAELASRLPPKRKAWKSEDARMDIFDAVGLAVASEEIRRMRIKG